MCLTSSTRSDDAEDEDVGGSALSSTKDRTLMLPTGETILSEFWVAQKWEAKWASSNALGDSPKMLEAAIMPGPCSTSSNPGWRSRAASCWMRARVPATQPGVEINCSRVRVAFADSPLSSFNPFNHSPNGLKWAAHHPPCAPLAASTTLC